MDMRPLDDAMLGRIRAREARRNLPAVDWLKLAGQSTWMVIAEAPAESTREERMREFNRLRKQGRDWGSRNGMKVVVRREGGARTIIARAEPS